MRNQIRQIFPATLRANRRLDSNGTNYARVDFECRGAVSFAARQISCMREWHVPRYFVSRRDTTTDLAAAFLLLHTHATAA